ncbi:tRNA-intron lyase [Ignisphaera sp. 4213-co]|uniref:tRNA-intron lyase n=1 Tax=Ignisphaera cupida TaxID=3050454 RepID=A0ABD4Z6T2_9CREN|nr:tRNA-intron lyase [Ignisphaera sp. 4213-co]MDK6028444.1 tRNA-intron lyase [Ignisphaera sp. 4213-co]
MSSHSKEELKVYVYIIGWKGIVLDIEKASKLFKMFIGKPLGVAKPNPNTIYNAPLVLSMYETLYLCEKGVAKPLIHGVEISCTDLEKYSERIMPQFRRKYMVFKQLREQGYVVRSGMKFGSDFTVYELGPGLEHAPYVVTVVSCNDSLRAVDIVGLGRIGHSVRKRSVLAIVDEKTGSVNYIVFKWVKI